VLRWEGFFSKEEIGIACLMILHLRLEESKEVWALLVVRFARRFRFYSRMSLDSATCELEAYSRPLRIEKQIIIMLSWDHANAQGCVSTLKQN
jgi:hypothetical protein